MNGGTKNSDLLNRVDFVEEALYEVRRKIYPRAVGGWFARWRVAMVLLTQMVFYGTPWLPWNERQAVLFDLAARKFYIFGLVFWPQDFIYLTVLLVISALSLFLFTAVAGRLWCGYACPQTVYTEIFLWIERKVEGNSVHQMKLDQGALSLRKLRLKAAKHGIWIGLSLWTGFTFVGYFTPIRQLASEVAAFDLGPWEMFWVLFYGFATYGNAGWMREQVCKYMCPYARFQSAMFDSDTMIITYDRARGEPRGARSRAADPKTSGLGDCIDCRICVQVCPTGIDIREGLQYECIGCAACIDGCNQVMKKMGYAPGLIRYSTENALRHGWNFAEMVKRAFRPRVLVYTAILWAIIIGAGTALFLRVPLKVDVIRDRAILAREVGDGRIENVYRLQVMNTEEKSHRFVIKVKGSDDLEHLEVLSDPQPFEIGPVSSRLISVRVRAEPEHDERGTERIYFIIEASDDEKHVLPEIFSVKEKSSFFIPGNSR
ncbi:MAG: cytochrome c oxidase accessory protein CcoG [Burkholderiales bacterium]